MRVRSSLPLALYRAESVRTLDREAIEGGGIAGLTLMNRAGAAAFEVLRTRWPEARRILVLCGPGNNGGDGYVLAREARRAGLTAAIQQVGDTALKGDARAAAETALAAGLAPQPFDASSLGGHEVLVDAMLGTGLDREVRDEYRLAIESVNQSPCPRLSIDIPSGLNADTGAVMGAAVRAEATVSFIGLKQGMFTRAGPEHCGEIYYDDLSVPCAVFERVPCSARRLELGPLRRLLPQRPRDAHKGRFGHVLVVGGEIGYAGAARMAGEAALRVGAGLVSLATRAAHAATLCAARPEIMCHPVETASEIKGLLDQATVIALGPGLGRSSWAVNLLARVIESELPMVADADALNLIALDPIAKSTWTLTPHPGEAARLLGMTVAEVQADRFRAVAELQRRYGGVAILKGCGTLICGPNGDTSLCAYGNPGMASGGMGDVLTGVIAGLLGQGLSSLDAATLGACLHARAGDRAAASGQRGLLASDLFPHLRYLANPTQSECDVWQDTP
ncbi:MAG: NAD(P)H-hydrate dehydratase [Chromatiales bacterium]